MLRIIVNTIKLLMNKKSFIFMGILAPALVIVFFSFAFGNDTNYKVGVVDKDNSYISNEIVETINNIENVDTVDISKDNYDMLLASHQIELAVVIENDEVIVKSISKSDIYAVILSIIESKVDNLNLISKISSKDSNKIKEYKEAYKDNLPTYNLNEVSKSRPSVENSIGIVIMMILISGASIANFLIEDEENNTKSRVLASGIKPYKYYISLLIVFYLLSSVSSVIYYGLCKILNLNFNMINTNNFLLVMLFLNLVSISLNLCIVSFTNNRYIASTVNILIVIPTCMLSGVFWDFKVMPDYLQKLGGYLPQRWVYVCIENLQMYDSLNSINQYIMALILLSIILLCISLFMFKIRNSKRSFISM